MQKLVALISYNIHSMHMNYGAALHSYAFQKYLDSLGINSIIIDYYPQNLKNYHIKYPIANNFRFWHFVNYAHHLSDWGLGFFSNLRKFNKFKQFFQKYTKKTKKTYLHSDLKKMTNIEGLDITHFVCESDVIWKLNENEFFNTDFFLDFPAAETTKKIAYSPSLSSKPFSSYEESIFKKLVSNFTAISTREQQGAEYLSKLLNKDIPWLLDPSLLLNANDYSKIATRIKEKNYLLIYNCMRNDVEMIKEARSLSQRLGLKTIEISNYYSNKIRFNHKVITDASIEDWLGYFQNASYIVCNAFHGFCFSIIFKKQVFLFQRDLSDFRMQNIVDALGISDRLIPWNNKRIPTEFQEINYTKVESQLSSLKLKSLNFIKTNIVEC